MRLTDFLPSMTAENPTLTRDLTRWGLLQLGLPETTPATLSVVSGDASFRRYYRLTLDSGEAFIAVYAPPDK